MNDKIYPSLVAKNLDFLMRKRNLNPNSLAEATETNQPTIHRIMAGESTDPRQSTLQPYADFFGISVSDLRSVDLSSGLDRNVETMHMPARQSQIPLISWVQAGAWTGSDNVEITEWRNTSRRHSKNAFALRVRGESMYNPGYKESFEENDVILVDPEISAKSGSLVIACLENTGETTFKKLLIEDGQYFLKALNPQWTPRLTKIDDPVVIQGCVFEKQVDF